MSRSLSFLAFGPAVAAGMVISAPASAVASYSANATNDAGVVTAAVAASGIGTGTVSYDYFTPATAGGSYLALPSGALTGALITSTAAIGSTTDFDFTAVTLINSANSAIQYAFTIGTFGSVDMASIFTPLTTPLGITAGNYFLRVDGVSRGSGSYGGQVTFTPSAAVPEPAAWLMMVAGFGLLGAALRRRPRTVALTYA